MVYRYLFYYLVPEEMRPKLVHQADRKETLPLWKAEKERCRLLHEEHRANLFNDVKKFIPGAILIDSPIVGTEKEK